MIGEQTRAALAAQEFGGPFVRHPQDAALARELLDGTLRLNPHPDHRLPEAIDWRADPFADRNWRAQFHMLRWLDPLRRVASDGDTAAFVRWWSTVTSWAAACADPDTAPAEAWMDMVDGMRAIELSLGALVVAQHQPESLGALEDLLDRHGAWLADHAHRGRSNHALHQLQGLLLCGIARERRDWVDQATGELAALFAEEYDHQGVNREGAIAYHHNNYLWWRDAVRRVSLLGGEVPAVFGLLDAVPEELAHATQPDGSFVSIGNSLGGSPRTIDHPHTRYVTSAGSRGEPPDDLIRVYEAGYLFARSGWGENERDFSEETFYSVVFGSNRKVHGHTDGGSLTYFANRVPWVVDPGKFSYDESADRIHFMARTSHNVVTLVGLPYDRTRPVELVRSVIEPTHHDHTLRDSGYDDATITRRIVYSVTGEYLVVIDTIRAALPVTAVQSWQLAAEAEAAHTAPTLVELRAGEARAAIVSFGVRPEVSITSGQSEPLSGWVATGWRQKAPAPRIALRKSGDAFRFITVIAAGFRDAPVRVTIVRDLPRGVLGLDVATGRTSERIVITDRDVLLPGLGASAAEIAERVAARSSRAVRPIRPRRDREVRDAIRAAKRRRWETPLDPDAAAPLMRLLAELDDPVVDHGLRAAIADITRRPGDEGDVTWRQGLVNWTGEADWAPTRYRYPIESRRSAAAELPDRDTILTHDLGHLTLPVAWLPGEGRVLTVLFHGAVDRGRTRLPLFQRLTSHQALARGPILAFSDPTLDLSGTLRLGWYLGTAEIDLPVVMAEIVRAAQAASRAELCILEGGSGGGFAAIATATHVPGSVAVAFNPQTDVRAYVPRFVRECLAAVFPDNPLGAGRQNGGRLSLMERMEAAGQVPRIELVVNTGDEFHRTRHATPLLEYLAARDPSALAVTELDLGAGHRSLDGPTHGRVIGAVHAKYLS